MIKIHNVTQGTDEWKELRLNCVGGSNFHKLLGKDETMYKYVDELKNPSDDGYNFSNASTDWGNEYEHEARTVYNVKYKSNVAEVGAISNSEYKHFTLSPDGIVYDDDKIVGAIEIKCRSSKLFEEFRKKRKIKKPARSQCIAYFIAIPTLEYVDYVEYDPRQRYNKNMEVVRLNRSEILEEIEAAEKRLRLFIKLMED